MREARNISAPNVASLLEVGYKPAEERFCGPLLRERHNRSSPTTQFAFELEFTGTNTGVMTMAGREIPTNRQDCAQEGRLLRAYQRRDDCGSSALTLTSPA